MKRKKRNRIKSAPKKRLLTLILPGLAAGALNGLFGCGGGIVSMLALSRYLPDEGDDRDRTGRIFSCTVLSVIPMSLGSVPVYGSLGAVSVGEILPILLPAIIGGILGAFFLSRINTGLLKKIFAAVVIWSGIRLMMR